MGVSIQYRRGTAAEWTGENLTLLEGEAGYETDTGKLKVGDGSTAWNDLDYLIAGTVVEISDHLENPPTEDEDTKAPTSEWAFDHAAGAVMKSDFNEQTILAAAVDDTPAALTVTEQTVLGRITGGNVAALTVAQLITLALSAALPENVGIILDAALSADGKWSGIVETGVLGETCIFGDLLYFKAADSQWYKAKADAAATSAGKLGICLVAGNDEDPTTLLLWGKVRADAAFPDLTIGAPVFISAATAGDVVTSAPSGTTDFVVRIVGYGNTADEMYFCPDNSYLELA